MEAKNASVRVRIIRPSSREQQDLLPARVEALAARGITARHQELPRDPSWLYVAATAADRARSVQDALLEPDTHAVISARGGYGASDLLPLIDWNRLRNAKPKWLVGFSDVSALHSALYAQLGWPGIHGPMPATTLWEKDGETRDVDTLLEVLRNLAAGTPTRASLPVQAVLPAGIAPTAHAPYSGKLFGGCFTVLTNLLGTPYFPRTLEGHIVFLEDTDEHPGRLMRALNQWVQSGILRGARALVIGHLRNLGDKIPDSAPFVLDEFARRTGLPTFATTAFGHTCPNFPLMIGADARIDAGSLTWHHGKGLST